jgi:hypothetical protein
MNYQDTKPYIKLINMKARACSYYSLKENKTKKIF